MTNAQLWEQCKMVDDVWKDGDAVETSRRRNDLITAGSVAGLDQEEITNKMRSGKFLQSC
jgi:uncharacterized protein YfiM (DUF2279 family)